MDIKTNDSKNVSLIKDRIVATDEVLLILSEKHKSNIRLENKCKKLLNKYIEKIKEVEETKKKFEDLEHRLSECTVNRTILEKEHNFLQESYSLLEKNHNEYVNSAELKYQTACLEIVELNKKCKTLNSKLEKLTTKENCSTNTAKVITKLQNELQEKNEELEKYSTKHDELNKKFKILVEKHNNDLKHIAELRKKEQEFKNSPVQKTKNKRYKKNDELQKECQEKTHELEVLQLAHENDIDTLRKKYEKEKELLVSQIASFERNEKNISVTTRSTQVNLDEEIDMNILNDIFSEMSSLPSLMTPLTIGSVKNDIDDEENMEENQLKCLKSTVACGPDIIIPIFANCGTQTDFENEFVPNVLDINEKNIQSCDAQNFINSNNSLTNGSVEINRNIKKKSKKHVPISRRSKNIRIERGRIKKSYKTIRRKRVKSFKKAPIGINVDELKSDYPFVVFPAGINIKELKRFYKTKAENQNTFDNPKLFCPYNPVIPQPYPSHCMPPYIPSPCCQNMYYSHNNYFNSCQKLPPCPCNNSLYNHHNHLSNYKNDFNEMCSNRTPNSYNDNQCTKIKNDKNSTPENLPSDSENTDDDVSLINFMKEKKDLLRKSSKLKNNEFSKSKHSETIIKNLNVPEYKNKSRIFKLFGEDLETEKSPSRCSSSSCVSSCNKKPSRNLNMSQKTSLKSEEKINNSRKIIKSPSNNKSDCCLSSCSNSSYVSMKSSKIVPQFESYSNSISNKHKFINSKNMDSNDRCQSSFSNISLSSTDSNKNINNDRIFDDCNTKINDLSSSENSDDDRIVFENVSKQSKFKKLSKRKITSCLSTTTDADSESSCDELIKDKCLLTIKTATKMPEDLQGSNQSILRNLPIKIKTTDNLNSISSILNLADSVVSLNKKIDNLDNCTQAMSHTMDLTLSINDNLNINPKKFETCENLDNSISGILNKTDSIEPICNKVGMKTNDMETSNNLNISTSVMSNPIDSVTSIHNNSDYETNQIGTGANLKSCSNDTAIDTNENGTSASLNDSILITSNPSSLIHNNNTKLKANKIERSENINNISLSTSNKIGFTASVNNITDININKNKMNETFENSIPVISDQMNSISLINNIDKNIKTNTIETCDSLVNVSLALLSNTDSVLFTCSNGTNTNSNEMLKKLTNSFSISNKNNGTGLVKNNIDIGTDKNERRYFTRSTDNTIIQSFDIHINKNKSSDIFETSTPVISNYTESISMINNNNKNMKINKIESCGNLQKPISIRTNEIDSVVPICNSLENFLPSIVNQKRAKIDIDNQIDKIERRYCTRSSDNIIIKSPNCKDFVLATSPIKSTNIDNDDINLKEPLKSFIRNFKTSTPVSKTHMKVHKKYISSLNNCAINSEEKTLKPKRKSYLNISKIAEDVNYKDKLSCMKPRRKSFSSLDVLKENFPVNDYKRPKSALEIIDFNYKKFDDDIPFVSLNLKSTSELHEANSIDKMLFTTNHNNIFSNDICSEIGNSKDSQTKMDYINTSTVNIKDNSAGSYGRSISTKELFVIEPINKDNENIIFVNNTINPTSESFKTVETSLSDEIRPTIKNIYNESQKPQLQNGNLSNSNENNIVISKKQDTLPFMETNINALDIKSNNDSQYLETICTEKHLNLSAWASKIAQITTRRSLIKNKPKSNGFSNMILSNCNEKNSYMLGFSAEEINDKNIEANRLTLSKILESLDNTFTKIQYFTNKSPLVCINDNLSKRNSLSDINSGIYNNTTSPDLNCLNLNFLSPIEETNVKIPLKINKLKKSMSITNEDVENSYKNNINVVKIKNLQNKQHKFCDTKNISKKFNCKSNTKIRRLSKRLPKKRKKITKSEKKSSLIEEKGFKSNFRELQIMNTLAEITENIENTIEKIDKKRKNDTKTNNDVNICCKKQKIEHVTSNICTMEKSFYSLNLPKNDLNGDTIKKSVINGPVNCDIVTYYKQKKRLAHTHSKKEECINPNISLMAIVKTSGLNLNSKDEEVAELHVRNKRPNINIVLNSNELNRNDISKKVNSKQKTIRNNKIDSENIPSVISNSEINKNGEVEHFIESNKIEPEKVESVINIDNISNIELNSQIKKKFQIEDKVSIKNNSAKYRKIKTSLLDETLPVIQNKRKTNIFKKPEKSKFKFIPTTPKSPDFIPYVVSQPKIIPLERTKTAKLTLMKQYIRNILNEDCLTHDIFSTNIKPLSQQDSKMVARALIEEVLKDTSNELDKTYTPPAPLLNKIQQRAILFLDKLSNLDNHENIHEHILTFVHQRLMREKRIQFIHSLTRFYVGVGMQRYNSEKVRMMIVNAAYCMDEYFIPVLFIALTMYPEILTTKEELKERSAVEACVPKILVQVAKLKSCSKPGYNLKNLNFLLLQHYGYEMLRVNNDTLIEELVKTYTETGSKIVYSAIVLLCKNLPSSWTFNQVEKYFMPLVNKNLQNTKCIELVSLTIQLIARIIQPFCNKIEDDDKVQKVRDWLLGFIEVNNTLPLGVRNSVSASFMCLVKKTIPKQKKFRPKKQFKKVKKAF